MSAHRKFYGASSHDLPQRLEWVGETEADREGVPTACRTGDLGKKRARRGFQDSLENAARFSYREK